MIAALAQVPIVLLLLSQASQSDKSKLDHLREAWATALRQKQLDTAINLYAPNATFFGPDGTQSTGTTAIRSLFIDVMKTFTSDLHFHSTALEVSGDLAYDSGTYHETLTTTADGVKKQIQGTYLTVLKRDPSGTWKIVQQMWTFAP